jgi:hypothetical protein
MVQIPERRQVDMDKDEAGLVTFGQYLGHEKRKLASLEDLNQVHAYLHLR